MKTFKKVQWKKITGALAAAALTMSLSVTPVLAGSVTYAGQSKGFVFAPGSEASPTDLFGDTKNLVPGDEVSEAIEVKNNGAEKKEVKIYLRALGADADSADFLSQLQLKVRKGNGTLFDATADQKGGLTNWVLLDTLAYGKSTSLAMTLQVPVSMGNDYQDKLGSLSWEFKVEETENPKTDTKTNTNTNKNTAAPKTGDPGASTYLALFAAAAAGLVLGVAARKRRG